MGSIFFDNLIEIERVKIYIDKVTETHEEKEDLWDLVDEYINRKIVSAILSELDENSQEEFLSMFLSKPYDNGIKDYLNSRLENSLEYLIGLNKENIIKELDELFEIQSEKKKLKNAASKKNK